MALLVDLAPAQCAMQWLSGPGSPGTNFKVSAMRMWDPDGPGPMQSVVVIGGGFSLAGGVPANRIALYDPASGVWSALGTGMNGFNGVIDLATLPNGDLVACGDFTMAGGTAISRIARWNGTSWSALGTGLNGQTPALMTLPNGDLVAGGLFTTAGGVAANYIARWNGTSWSAMGTGMSAGGGVFALTMLPNGDLVASGRFTTAGGVAASNIARWDGTSWSALGSGLNLSEVPSLTTLPNGDLVAGGLFTTAGGVAASNIARWNGTSWSALGAGVNGEVLLLAALPNGDVLASGFFTTAGGLAANHIARWNGASWSALGAGIDNWAGAHATLANGDLVVGGDFTTAGGVAANRVARLTTTCPASATSLGTGCPSSVGPMVLSPRSLPWVGSTFLSSCNNIAPLSFAFGLLGLSSPGTPLMALHPAGGVGCSLLASPDAVALLSPSAGEVTSTFVLPGNPAFAGLLVCNQVLLMEVDSSLNITGIASSNGITLTIGAF